MKDAQLEIVLNFPAAGANATSQYLDIGVDTSDFSDQWREGRLRVSYPALPNLTSTGDNITVTLQDSLASSSPLSFANTNPAITATITGVATNGVAAGFIDMPLPPGLRGPFQLFVAATAGAGNNTQQQLTADWLME